MSELGSDQTKLAPIPQKKYFTIGEVANLCEVEAHVLRYWEQEFEQLEPVKRRGNRRYYQHNDLLIIRRIRALLHDRGFTIKGARQQIAGKGLETDDLTQYKQLISQLIVEIEDALRVSKL